MKSELLLQLQPHDQEHVLTFWDELSSDAQAMLAEQIRTVDLSLLKRLWRNEAGAIDWKALATRAEAPHAIRLDAQKNATTQEAARIEGETALRAGRVGVIIVAGGQGTRLGFPRPKGMFPIGPVSGATLFQMLFEKIIAVGRKYGVRVPLYLMTSPATHEETLDFLDVNSRFGLLAEDLHVFCQGTMPAVEIASGKLLLAEKGELSLSPDGHGGTLAGLAKSGGLDDIRLRGVEQLFYIQVDNPLSPVCDPEYIGHHRLAESELTTLVVAKHAPLDKVGNFVSIDGAARIIEYSDLPAAVAEQFSTRDGSLKLWAGNTAMHVFDAAFLERMSGDAESLPFHLARKKVPFVNAEGKMIEVAEPNAIKFERFIFDLLPAAKNPLAIEVEDRLAFMPVKNAPGEKRDTPESARAALVALHRSWLKSAGAIMADNVLVEISPLFANSAEECRDKIAPGLRVDQPMYLV